MAYSFSRSETLYVERLPQTEQIVAYHAWGFYKGDKPERYKKVSRLVRPTIPTLEECGPFAAWNVGFFHVMRNCHQFAVNSYEPYVPYPGEGFHHIGHVVPGAIGGDDRLYHSLGDWKDEKDVVRTFRDCMVADHLRPLEAKDYLSLRVKSYEYAILLRLDLKDQGFHFMRRDEETGQWFEKPDPVTPVTNRDGKGKIIVDPMAANHCTIDLNFGDVFSYETFGGFYAVEAGALPGVNLISTAWRPGMRGPVRGSQKTSPR